MHCVRSCPAFSSMLLVSVFTAVNKPMVINHTQWLFAAADLPIGGNQLMLHNVSTLVSRPLSCLCQMSTAEQAAALLFTQYHVRQVVNECVCPCQHSVQVLCVLFPLLAIARLQVGHRYECHVATPLSAVALLLWHTGGSSAAAAPHDSFPVRMTVAPYVTLCCLS